MENVGVSVVSLVPLLNVRDVAKSLEFYNFALGFSIVSKTELDGKLSWARIQSGPIELMLNASEISQKEEGAQSRRIAGGSFSDVVLYFEVPDVDALHAKLKSMDISVTPPFDTPHGAREMHAWDFDGYQLAFTSPLQAA